MRADSIAFALSGMLFGVIVGWILGSQQSAGPAPAAAAATAPSAATPAAAGRPPAPPLDEARLKTLIAAAGSEPTNPAPRVQLGNLYFDAERYTDSVQWYEDALRLQPKDANVSTDLGVAYYYTNEPAAGHLQLRRRRRSSLAPQGTPHGDVCANQATDSTSRNRPHGACRTQQRRAVMTRAKPAKVLTEESAGASDDADRECLAR